MSCFHQAFGSLQHHFGEMSMRLGWFVKCRTDDLGLYGALQVSDLLRSLSNQGDQQLNVVIVLSDGVGDGFEQHGLARLGWCDDQTALSPSNRRHQVDETA